VVRRDDVALRALRVIREVFAYAKRRGLFVSVAAIDAAWPAVLGQRPGVMPWVAPVAVIT